MNRPSSTPFRISCRPATTFLVNRSSLQISSTNSCVLMKTLVFPTMDNRKMGPGKRQRDCRCGSRHLTGGPYHRYRPSTRNSAQAPPGRHPARSPGRGRPWAPGWGCVSTRSRPSGIDDVFAVAGFHWTKRYSRGFKCEGKGRMQIEGSTVETNDQGPTRGGWFWMKTMGSGGREAAEGRDEQYLKVYRGGALAARVLGLSHV